MKLLSPGRMVKSSVPIRPEQCMCRAVFPSFTNVQSYQGYLATETIISTQSSVNWENALKLFPRRPEQLVCTAEDSHGSLMKSLSKTIFPLKLLYQLTVLCLRRIDRSSCLLKNGFQRPEQWIWITLLKWVNVFSFQSLEFLQLLELLTDKIWMTFYQKEWNMYSQKSDI